MLAKIAHRGKIPVSERCRGVSRTSGDLLPSARRGLFLCDDEKTSQVRLPERSGYRYISGIAARCHQYAANPGLIVPGVERPPTAFEIDLEPCAEVHGKDHGDADIAQITGRIARGNVECPAKGNGKMLKVATYAHAFSKDIEGSLCGPRMLIVKRHFVVDPVADSLHAAPAGWYVPKKLKRDGRETIHLAVAAIEQKAEHFVRQIADRRLPCGQIDFVQ